MSLRVFLLALFPLVFAARLPAQRVLSSLDISGTGVWYGDSVRSTGGSLTPAIRLDWPNATLGATSTLSHVGGGVNAQGSLTSSLFSPTLGMFSAEATGSFGGSTHPDGTRTGEALGVARLYASSRVSGAWLGFGAGSTWDGATWRGVRQAELGTWTRARDITALATVTPVVVANSIHYSDFQIALRRPSARVELGVLAGARAGSVGAAVGGTSRVWGSASGTVRLSPSLAIVASAGTYPVDLTQGYPGGRFVSVAMRIASTNSRPAASTEQRATASTNVSMQSEAMAASDFVVSSVGGTRRTLRLRAPTARSVEVIADFTQWKPVSMTRSNDGAWTITLDISRGVHQLNLRVDGGGWIVPPGLLSTSDEFGGVTGILRVE